MLTVPVTHREVRALGSGRRVRRRGRPPHVGVKSWHRSVPLERLVRSVLAPREQGDELAATTNSEVVVRILRIGRRYVGRVLTAPEQQQLRRAARSAKPSGNHAAVVPMASRPHGPRGARLATTHARP